MRFESYNNSFKVYHPNLSNTPYSILMHPQCNPINLCICQPERDKRVRKKKETLIKQKKEFVFVLNWKSNEVANIYWLD